MSDVTELRALLRDRQEKEQLGTDTYDLCLDIEAAIRHHTLEQEREEAEMHIEQAKLQNKKSTDHVKRVKEIDGELEELQGRMQDSTVTLEFKAIPSKRYEGILADHPNANDGGFRAFADELIETCYRGCYRNGNKIDIDYAEIAEAITYGEYEPLQALVLSLNRRKVDTPFSGKSSSKTAS